MNVSKIKYFCPCCGYRTLNGKPPGTYQICPVCYWEDDYVQSMDASISGPPNGISLEEARSNFSKYSAVLERLKKYVRPARSDEI